MRILFICPRMQLNLAQGNTPPLSVLSLASFIQREGHEVRIYDRNIDRKSILHATEKFRPDVAVCTLMHSQQIRDMQSICIKLRASRPGLPILCGGLTASLFPELVLKECLVDYVGISEGEYTLMELLEVICGRRDPSSVQSLVYLDCEGKLVRTPLRPFADLLDFPDTDFSLLPMEKYFVFYPEAPRTLSVYASKGCFGRCTFCFNADYSRCQYRLRKRESVMREIEILVSDYGADGIVFIDEIWCFNKGELHAYCDDFSALSRKLGKQIRWYCQTRIGVLRLEDLRLMADAGCFMIPFGLESGSPEILARIKKGYSLNRVETDINNCKAVGISTNLLVIFGFPDETPAQIKQTVHTIFRLNPTFYSASLFTAAPCTADYDALVLSGRLMPTKDLKSWIKQEDRLKLSANYSAVPNRELKVVYYFFYWRLLFQDRKDQKINRRAFLKMGFRRVLDNIGRKGFFKFCFKQAHFILCTAWHYYAYPGIRKKYDLYPRNFGRSDWDDLAHLDTEKE